MQEYASENILAEIKERKDWTKKHYGIGLDQRKFGYETLSNLDEKQLGIPGSIQNYVRLEGGLWIPEHLHMKKDEFFVVMDGEAIFYILDGRDLTKDLFIPDNDEFVIDTRYSSKIKELRNSEEGLIRLFKKGDLFRIKPKEIHGVHNTGPDYLYLCRFALNNEKGDSYYTEEMELMEN